LPEPLHVVGPGGLDPPKLDAKLPKAFAMPPYIWFVDCPLSKAAFDAASAALLLFCWTLFA
jgi:hypothetical protein